ncbi:TPM domain-containing protein [Flavobacterium terrae]|uniref:TLP18.3, Psb32 and MOLO-1 founding protein of phosphatase n=1 Tax=Flavobacterium terrae TaxID=415425 RepID=A0A1M6DKH7_9FLAO|nr:TPM domain-containing protein [Flavobacterium terrae]SHI73623.1 TLP18.3, Psb32 and MOLO-1 founding protein of phosphatase [Flavobacterium terrae]
MSVTEDFLTTLEEQEIVDAIQTAEKNTSGEIRVHIEAQNEKPPFERAQEVFFSLNMNMTLARNGVLFYVNVSNKSFVILGDEGINKVVESDFWDCTKDIVLEHFKEKKFKDGLVAGILRAGERLKAYFPFQADDTNELPNEISKS